MANEGSLRDYIESKKQSAAVPLIFSDFGIALAAAWFSHLRDDVGSPFRAPLSDFCYLASGFFHLSSVIRLPDT
jgi:hypothetical protein